METLEVAQPKWNVPWPMDLAEHRLPSTHVLAGEKIEITFDDGSALALALDADTLRWRLTDEDGHSAGGECAYDAVETRPGLFFLDFVAAGAQRAVTTVVDRGGGRALALVSDIVDSDGQADLQQRVRTGRVAGAEGKYEPITATRELLGRRLYCEYSNGVAIEHVYLNSQAFAWQRLKTSIDELTPEVGIETGMIWKIGPELFLLHSRGRLPVALILLLDLEQRRNVGRLFGTGNFGPVDDRCGAKITFLGRMAYPDGYEPA
ncbi:MAG: MoaF N-terminal domain-containing protein [Solirubrobacterales bacterium]|nr:MoaF N-terminal domain-containing protein [Solirubrobacterales bacterium]